MPTTPPRRDRRRGFTLVEVLIVVVILGILAAIVIPTVANAVGDSEQTMFSQNLRSFVSAALLFREETGSPLEDSSSGALPAGFGLYVREHHWTGGTPIGGVWDAERNSYGVQSALGVHFNGQGQTRDDAYMTRIDVMLDDGVLTTGTFRKIASDRYYWILAE
jgi:prepilin-type N-terminal cleavage/methylation domain-containing protein